jgi:hypothetical protein
MNTQQSKYLNTLNVIMFIRVWEYSGDKKKMRITNAQMHYNMMSDNFSLFYVFESDKIRRGAQ